VIWHFTEKFNVGAGVCFMEVDGSKLRSSISIDLSDIDVFNSFWVITWGCEFTD
jgi:hypothetical protein